MSRWGRRNRCAALIAVAASDVPRAALATGPELVDARGDIVDPILGAVNPDSGPGVTIFPEIP